MKYFCVGVLWLLSFGVSGQAKNDEQLFRSTLKSLKNLVKTRDLDAASGLIHFPLYTAKSELQDGSYPSDLISKAEFKIYSSAIYNQEVIRILPELSEDNLSEIDGNSDTYYAALQKLTDKGSKLYEVYAEYNQQGRNTESYFAFIFGRIKGSYQIIAYYGKWPVR